MLNQAGAREAIGILGRCFRVLSIIEIRLELVKSILAHSGGGLLGLQQNPDTFRENLNSLVNGSHLRRGTLLPCRPVRSRLGAVMLELLEILLIRCLGSLCFLE